MTKNSYRKKPKERSSLFGFSIFRDRKFHLFIGFLLLLSSIFLLVSFISYLKQGRADQSVVESFLNTNVKEAGLEVRNFFGLMGAVSSYYFMFLWFGIASLLIPPFLFLLGYRIVWKKAIVSTSKAFHFTTFYLIWTSLVMGYFLLINEKEDISPGLGYLSGGIGFELATVLESLTGWSAPLFLAFLFLVFNMYFFNITTLPALDRARDYIHALSQRFFEFISFRRRKKSTIQDVLSVAKKAKMEVEREESRRDETETWTVKKVSTKKPERTQLSPEFTISRPPARETNTPEPLIAMTRKPETVTPSPRPTYERLPKNPSFEITQNDMEEEHVEKQANYDPTLDLPTYQFPGPSLLIDYPAKDVRVTKDELEQNKDRIIETLVNFKIGISSIKATIGPTVTLYEIVPEAGVKISRIKSLEDDIALNLAALGIRIIAPIPGKGTIGIEVPNKNREKVDIKSVITTSKFMESAMELPLVLGKTISNEVYVTDLSKMPHLLMAGATGQGKSVGLNIMLASLLYKKHPSHLKFVLVDPKKVELTLFNKIERHFLAKLPDSEEAIITDTNKVVNTLHSLCIEMDSRYDLLKLAECRNIKEYNKKFMERRLNPNKGHRHLPYIVLVVDELADLIMTAGKEIETPIARLAQLARAIGIHLIVATQRPSVNVITGVIKANFPARLSFRVTSKIDSRTILDTGGADQLVGMGDMLLSTESDIMRLQCPFIDTPEVERICEFIGAQKGYATAYLLPEYSGDDEGGIGDIDLAERDALFADAARLIVRHQQGSTSLIQRKMKLGYNRAGRLIDQLEAAGIVGPFEGSKAREVLVQDEHSLEQLLTELENKF